MNWDAIGAIAELLGAIGVIESLVWRRVRRSTWRRISGLRSVSAPPRACRETARVEGLCLQT